MMKQYITFVLGISLFGSFTAKPEKISKEDAQKEDALKRLQQMQRDIQAGVTQPAKPAGVAVDVHTVSASIKEVLDKHALESKKTTHEILSRTNISLAEKERLIKQAHATSRESKKQSIQKVLASHNFIQRLKAYKKGKHV